MSIVGFVTSLVVGVWNNLTLNEPKIQTGGLQVPGVRVEGARAFLRGSIKIKEATLANDTLFTIPGGLGLRPVADVELERVTSGGKLLRVKIAAATGICSTTEALVVGEILFFDGYSYNLS